MKKKIFISTILVEIVIIFFLFFLFLKKSQFKMVLGESTSSVIAIATPSAELKNYYEHEANNIMHEEIDHQQKDYKINSDTINSLKEYSIKKPNNTYRIITLGDSWTFGFHVNTEDNWATLLENELNNKCFDKKYEVINLGVEGYDSIYSLERFKRRGEKYDPDLVLWLHTDIERYMEEMLPIMNAVDSDDQDTKWIKARKYLLDKYNLDQLYEIQEKAMKEITKYYTGRVGFVISPRIKEYADKIKKTALVINGFAIVLPDLPQDAIVKGDTHPNEKGHRIITKDIFSYLVDKKIITCSK